MHYIDHSSCMFRASKRSINIALSCIYTTVKQLLKKGQLHFSCTLNDDQFFNLSEQLNTLFRSIINLSPFLAYRSIPFQKIPAL